MKSTIAGENYRKLWVMGSINVPFIYAVALLREKWPTNCDRSLPIEKRVHFFSQNLEEKTQIFFSSNEFAELAPAIISIGNLSLSKPKKKRLFEELLEQQHPFYQFMQDVAILAKRFGFEEFWHFSLMYFIITDEISPPNEERSENIPSRTVMLGCRSFALNCKKEWQQKHLEESCGLSLEEIHNMSLEKIEKRLPSFFIGGDTDVCDRIFGAPSEDISNQELEETDRKNINKAKKYRQYARESEYFVSLRPQDPEELQALFSYHPTPKSR